jgi:hypothetical protein
MPCCTLMLAPCMLGGPGSERHGGVPCCCGLGAAMQSRNATRRNMQTKMGETAARPSRFLAHSPSAYSGHTEYYVDIGIPSPPPNRPPELPGFRYGQGKMLLLSVFIFAQAPVIAPPASLDKSERLLHPSALS